MALDQRIATDFLRAASGANYQLQTQGPPTVHRIGQIDATPGGGVVNITLGGGTVVLTGIPYMSTYSPTIGDVVQVRVRGTDLLVLGETA